MAGPDNLADRVAPDAAIGAALARARALLSPHSDSPQLDAELLLACVLKRPRSWLNAHAEQSIEPQLMRQYQSLLLRRARGEPVAYLTGEREFWSLPLTVTADVLVPRPETELAVERCLALLGDDVAVEVADLGTGSGAIAIALASERMHWKVIATDCSAAALQVARANAARHGLHSIQFLQGNWFEPLSGHRFDLIVSNPPYVAAGDPALHALRFEPAIALSPGGSGLEDLQAIVQGAPAHLRRGAWLVLEHGTGQAHALAQILIAAGYACVRCYSDLAGHERVTQAQWPSK
jgi:release factor glutamine methyltransferase